MANNGYMDHYQGPSQSSSRKAHHKKPGNHKKLVTALRIHNESRFVGALYRSTPTANFVELKRKLNIVYKQFEEHFHIIRDVTCKLTEQIMKTIVNLFFYDHTGFGQILNVMQKNMLPWLKIFVMLKHILPILQ